MCLAIPMRVVELKGDGGDVSVFEVAVVEVDGMSTEIRLDLLERMPFPGDYLIIHAGFAINVLDAAEAEENLALMRELAAAMDDVADREGR